MLELNTQPGMTSLSLVPEIANHSGITFENLVEKICWTQVSIDEKKIINRFWTIYFTNNYYFYKKINIQKFNIQEIDIQNSIYQKR